MLQRSLEIKNKKPSNKFLLDRSFNLNNKDDDKSDFKYKLSTNHLGELDNCNEIPEYERGVPMRMGYHTPKENKKKLVHVNMEEFMDTMDVIDNGKKSSGSTLDIQPFTKEYDNLAFEDKSNYFKDLHKSRIALDEITIYNNVSNEKSSEIFYELKNFIKKTFVVSP